MESILCHCLCVVLGVLKPLMFSFSGTASITMLGKAQTCTTPSLINLPNVAIQIEIVWLCTSVPPTSYSHSCFRRLISAAMVRSVFALGKNVSRYLCRAIDVNTHTHTHTQTHTHTESLSHTHTHTHTHTHIHIHTHTQLTEFGSCQFFSLIGRGGRLNCDPSCLYV